MSGRHHPMHKSSELLCLYVLVPGIESSGTVICIQAQHVRRQWESISDTAGTFQGAAP